MYYHDAFQILGISDTSDKKAIKRAYASLVKKYHPEDNPEQWAEVHKAYENALAYANLISKMSKSHEKEDSWNRESDSEQQVQGESGR